MSIYEICLHHDLPPPETTAHCKGCGYGLMAEHNHMGGITKYCARCGQAESDTLSSYFALPVEQKERQDVAVFWMIMAGAALIQSFMPSWVDKFCIRQRVPEGSDRWQVPLPTEEDYNVSWNDPPPVYSEPNEMTLHMDIHKIRLDTGLGMIMDGYWEIGLGFLFLGHDPEGMRCGAGVVYCWQRNLFKR